MYQRHRPAYAHFFWSGFGALVAAVLGVVFPPLIILFPVAVAWPLVNHRCSRRRREHEARRQHFERYGW